MQKKYSILTIMTIKDLYLFDNLNISIYKSFNTNLHLKIFPRTNNDQLIFNKNQNFIIYNESNLVNVFKMSFSCKKHIQFKILSKI